MKVFLLKDVVRVGLAGEIIEVSSGYATNFLFPRKLGVQVTAANADSFVKRTALIEKRGEIIESKNAMLAEKIKTITLNMKCKVHDGEKLYGAIGASDIVDLLKEKGIAIDKAQVVLDKAIKNAGTHSITIKLSPRIQSAVTLKISPEAK